MSIDSFIFLDLVALICLIYGLIDGRFGSWTHNESLMSFLEGLLSSGGYKCVCLCNELLCNRVYIMNDDGLWSIKVDYDGDIVICFMAFDHNQWSALNIVG